MTTHEMPEIQIESLIEAGTHFGHRDTFWNPKMSSFILKKHHHIHIIDPDQTKTGLMQAMQAAAQIIQSRGTILLVGTKKAAQESIQKAAMSIGMPYVNYRWLGGMLTNYKTVRQSTRRLRDLEQMRNGNSFKNLTKKEQQQINRQIQKLNSALGGIRDMNSLPDALFVIDIGYERIAVAEANKLGIPVIAVVDTNHDPHPAQYVIPGNDDSVRAIHFYTQVFSDYLLQVKSNMHPVESESKMTQTQSRSSPGSKRSPRAHAKREGESAS